MIFQKFQVCLLSSTLWKALPKMSSILLLLRSMTSNFTCSSQTPNTFQSNVDRWFPLNSNTGQQIKRFKNTYKTFLSLTTVQSVINDKLNFVRKGFITVTQNNMI